jgi:hypothetical protein
MLDLWALEGSSSSPTLVDPAHAAIVARRLIM